MRRRDEDRDVRTRSQRTGDAAEELVADRLAAAGWTVLGRNVRVGRAELDLVALDWGPPAALVVVEVRARRTRDFGLPEETIHAVKRRRVRDGARALRELGALPDGTVVPRLPLRIDLAVVEPPRVHGGPPTVRHHRAAL